MRRESRLELQHDHSVGALPAVGERHPKAVRAAFRAKCGQSRVIMRVRMGTVGGECKVQT